MSSIARHTWLFAFACSLIGLAYFLPLGSWKFTACFAGLFYLGRAMEARRWEREVEKLIVALLAVLGAAKERL